VRRNVEGQVTVASCMSSSCVTDDISRMQRQSTCFVSSLLRNIPNKTHPRLQSIRPRRRQLTHRTPAIVTSGGARDRMRALSERRLTFPHAPACSLSICVTFEWLFTRGSGHAVTLRACTHGTARRGATVLGSGSA
jgi:hypothetical protein